MEIRFEKIASFEIRHDFFKSETHDWNIDWPENYTEENLLKITPSKATLKKLKDFGIIHKSSQKGMDLYAEVIEDSGKLFLKKYTKNNLTFDFHISLKSHSWLLISRLTNEQNGICVYSNKEGFKTGGSSPALFLHNEIETSGPGTKEPAQLVRKGNTVYEALERTISQPAGAKWASLGTHQNFTTLKNQLLVKGKSLLISGGPHPNKTIKIKNVFSQVVLEEAIPTSSTLKEFNINIDFLEEGKYTYFLNDVEQEEFYFSTENVSSHLGVINLFIQGNPTVLAPAQRINQEWLPIGNGSNSILEGEINPTNYVIHFLPNRARWKYITSKDLSISPASSNTAGYDKLSNTEFISKKAQTLNSVAKGADFGLDNAFPAPGKQVLKTLKNGSDEVESYVSEIFVNV